MTETTKPDEIERAREYAEKEVPFGALYCGEGTPDLVRTALSQGYVAGLQSERERHRWIPCSERLPEKEGSYLIHARSADPDKPLIFVAWWNLKHWEGIPVVWSAAVDSWMPLPAKPEGES